MFAEPAEAVAVVFTIKADVRHVQNHLLKTKDKDQRFDKHASLS